VVSEREVRGERRVERDFFQSSHHMLKEEG
jgi:hypothetical protein